MSDQLPVPQNVEETFNALNAILSTADNNHRRFVERAVVNAMQNHVETFGNYLWELMSNTSAPAGERQLAAVLLRKRILTLYNTLPLDGQQQMKSTLLNLVGNEKIRLVRLAIANIICMLGCVEIDSDTWPELGQAMRAAAESGTSANILIALNLVYGISSAISNASDDLLGASGFVILTGLNSDDVEVRVQALNTVGNFLPFLDTTGHPATLSLIQEMIPLTLNCVEQHINNVQSVSMVLRTIEVLEQVVGMHRKKYGDYLSKIIMFMANTAGTRNAHLSVRQAASDILRIIIGNKPRMVYKSKLITPFVDLALQLLSEDERVVTEHKYLEEYDDYDEEEMEMLEKHPPAIIGGELLQALVECIPNKHVMPYLMERLMRIINNLQESTPLERKGVMMAIANTAEDASSYHRRQLTSVIEVVRTFVKDETPCVRESTMFALNMMVQCLQPDILLKHATIVEILEPLLMDNNDKVRSRAIETLDTLVEFLAEEADQYVERIIPRLLEAIPSSSMDTQGDIVSCLAGFAQHQPPSMTAYSDRLLTMLQEPLSLDTNDDTVRLKSYALEAVGNVALSVGRDSFQSYFNGYCNLALGYLKSQNERSELREQACTFFANIAKLLQRDFSQFLDETTKAILDVLREEDPSETTQTNPYAAVTLKSDDMDRELQDENEPMTAADLGMGDRVRVRGAACKEKEACIQTLGIFCKTQRDLMEPYAEDLEDVFEEYLQWMGGPTFEASVIALSHYCCIFAGKDPFPKEVEYPNRDRMTEKQRDAVASHLFTNIIPCIGGDNDKMNVGAAYQAMDVLIAEYGSQAVHEHIDKIIDCTAAILNNDAICQGGEGAPGFRMDDEEGMTGGAYFGKPENHQANDDGDEDEGEMLNHDNELIDAVHDSIEILCKAYGPGFAPFFNILGPIMLKQYFKEESPQEDVIMASGCIGECFSALGQAISPYADQAFSLCFYLFNNFEDSVVRGNACFILNGLIENLPHKLNAAKTKEILDVLWDMCSTSSEIPQGQDNAISTAMTLVRRLSVEQGQPLNEQQAYQIMKSALGYVPMKIDHTENKNIVETIGFLLTTNAVSSLTNSLVEEITIAVSRMLFAKTVPNELKNRLANVFQTTMAQSHRDQVRQAMNNQPSRVQQVFGKYIF